MYRFIYRCLAILADCIELAARAVYAYTALSFLYLVYFLTSDEKVKIHIPPRQLRSLKPVGRILGTKIGFYVVRKENSQGHCLTISPTGTGKTQGKSLPSDICWRYSILGNDVLKGDKLGLALEAQRRGVNCLIVNPSDRSSYGLDPYHFLRTSQEKDVVADIIARAIIPDPPAQASEPMWTLNAQLVIRSAILDSYYRGDIFTETMKELMETYDLTTFLRELRFSEEEAARVGMSGMASAGERTVGGIYSQFVRNISLFVINEAINDTLNRPRYVTPEDLDNGRSIFYTPQQRRLPTYRPFSRGRLNSHKHTKNCIIIPKGFKRSYVEDTE